MHGHSNLAHLVYTSAATTIVTPADIREILAVSRRNNAQRSVSGMLLFSNGTFFQVLEGEESTLSELFAVISADPRHRAVTTIIREPIARRVFENWSMGNADIGPADYESIDGFNDFFQHGASLANLGAGRAKNLLSAFAQGRWRVKLGQGDRMSGRGDGRSELRDDAGNGSR